jgi:hypothetical protein
MREHTDVKKLLQLILIAVVALVSVEVRDDLRAATASTRLATGGTLPTKCQLGDAFYRTGNVAGLYLCTAADAWSGQGFIKTFTLSDDQIKRLPTTPVTLQVAAGAGLLIDPIRINLFAKVSSGAYTNINAAGNLSAKYADGTTGFTYIPNDGAITTGSTTRLTDLLGTANYRRMFLQRYVDSEGLDFWGPLDTYLAGTAGSNSALQLFIDNNGSGNLTGGNAANTLTAVVTYSVVPVP